MDLRIQRLTLSGILLALGVILPQAFHFIPNAGMILLPMHIPVLLCGYFCGPVYGTLVGLFSPLLSHLLFSMPLSSNVIQMIFELGTYGLLTGILKNCNVYVSLIISMLLGRIVNGVINSIIVNSYAISTWISISFIKAIPGIIVQLIIIPILVKRFKRS